MTNNWLYRRSSWKNECFPDAVKDLLAKKQNKVCNLKYVIHQTSVFTDIHFGDVFHIHRKRKKKTPKKIKTKNKAKNSSAHLNGLNHGTWHNLRNTVFMQTK